jgi:hypothetical protein
MFQVENGFVNTDTIFWYIQNFWEMQYPVWLGDFMVLFFLYYASFQKYDFMVLFFLYHASFQKYTKLRERQYRILLIWHYLTIQLTAHNENRLLGIQLKILI